MGTRYFIEVECPKCQHIDKDVYFAPTCGFVTWVCPECDKKVDLCEYTGIDNEL